jgi:predicted DNA-binding transcriptional regulator AlpA
MAWRGAESARLPGGLVQRSPGVALAQLRNGGIEMDALLTPKEVSELLSVPIATLYSWRYRGFGPPSFHIGRLLRYPADELSAWIEEQGHLEERRTAARSAWQ